MASTAESPAKPGPSPGPTGPGRSRPGLPGWREVGRRLIALREGSIIVVTIIVAIYFSVNTSTFFTGSNFKTLLPYFAPLANSYDTTAVRSAGGASPNV